MMPLVIIESPFAGKGGWLRSRVNRWLNVRYARRCMKDSLNRGESPLASHLLYTQMLDDRVPRERLMGINAGLQWGKVAHLTAVYVDRGKSRGMEYGIDNAIAAGRKIEYRSLKKQMPQVAD